MLSAARAAQRMRGRRGPGRSHFAHKLLTIGATMSARVCREYMSRTATPVAGLLSGGGEPSCLSMLWRWAMTVIRFKVGDPVKARASGFVPQGTCGVICQVVLAVAG